MTNIYPSMNQQAAASAQRDAAYPTMVGVADKNVAGSRVVYPTMSVQRPNANERREGRSKYSIVPAVASYFGLLG